MKYVVLGMHKSGTTLMSNCLHASGINMVVNVMESDYDQGNKYERTDMVLTNIAAMNIAFSTESFKTTKYATPEPKFEPEIIKNHILNLISLLDKDYQNWGFKDPRTCLTYGIWNPYLGEHFMIGVFRSPWAVVNHYLSKRKFSSLRIDLTYRVLKTWFIYNSKILQHLTKTESVLINYGEFMRETNTLDKLSELLGVKLKDIRKKNLKRSNDKINFQSQLMCLFLKIINGYDIKSLYRILQEKSFSNE